MHRAQDIDLGDGIEPLDIIDIDDISSLLSEQILANPYYSELARRNEAELVNSRQLKKMIEEDPFSVLVSKSEEGIVTGVVVNKFDCNTRWLSWIIVRPGYRRSKYGSSLIAALKRIAIHTECHKIWCDSRPTNTESIQLLKKMGFRELVKLNNHWYRLDFILLECNLI